MHKIIIDMWWIVISEDCTEKRSDNDDNEGAVGHIKCRMVNTDLISIFGCKW